MSFLGDMLGFEGFQLKDWAKKLKANPEQLVIGAADPFGAKLWGGITGKDYEPFIDQMGGPYGGHAISAFGSNDGGVYGRAREAGIDTGPASIGHDAAHIVASIYGGAGLGKTAGGLFSGGPQAITPSQASVLNLPESAATLPEGTSAASGSWMNWFNQMPIAGQQPSQAPMAVDTREEERRRAAQAQAQARIGLGLLSRGLPLRGGAWGTGIGSTGGYP